MSKNEDSYIHDPDKVYKFAEDTAEGQQERMGPDSHCQHCGMTMDGGWLTCCDCQEEKGIKVVSNRRTGERTTLEGAQPYNDEFCYERGEKAKSAKEDKPSKHWMIVTVEDREQMDAILEVLEKAERDGSLDFSFNVHTESLTPKQ